MEFNKEEWMKEKKQQREELYNDINEEMNDIISSPEKFEQFLNTVSKFDQYSLNNLLLINKNNPDAVLLKSFDDWKKNDVRINKDEKGLYIFKPIMVKVKGQSQQRVNPVCVFDINQTNAEVVNRQALDDKSIVKGLISACQAEVVTSTDLAPTMLSYYDKENNVIHMKEGLESKDVIKNLSKEAAHSIHCNNNSNYDRNDYSRNAYVISYLTCKKQGIDVSNYRFDNTIESLSRLSPEELKESLTNLVKENKTLQHRINSYIYKEKQSHER